MGADPVSIPTSTLPEVGSLGAPVNVVDSKTYEKDAPPKVPSTPDDPAVPEVPELPAVPEDPSPKVNAAQPEIAEAKTILASLELIN